VGLRYAAGIKRRGPILYWHCPSSRLIIFFGLTFGVAPRTPKIVRSSGEPLNSPPRTPFKGGDLKTTNSNTNVITLGGL
jgi:hypothetical protein